MTDITHLYRVLTPVWSPTCEVDAVALCWGNNTIEDAQAPWSPLTLQHGRWNRSSRVIAKSTRSWHCKTGSAPSRIDIVAYLDKPFRNKRLFKVKFWQYSVKNKILLFQSESLAKKMLSFRIQHNMNRMKATKFMSDLAKNS